MILVGHQAPNFTTQAVLANGSIVDDFNLLDTIKGKYGVLFFYPLDFTFVCPSELIAMDHRTNALNKLNTEVIGISTDSHFTHRAWRQTSIDDGGIGEVSYTLAADMTRSISTDYGILNNSDTSYYPSGVAMRATFIIDQKGIVRHQTVNDEPLGRNMDEVIRIVEGLQFFENHGRVCPAGWQSEADGMSPDQAGVAAYLKENASKL